MIEVSAAYKEAAKKNFRNSYMTANFGIFDKEAKTKIDNITALKQPFSDINKIMNEIKGTNYNYITCEPGRVKLDGTFYFLRNKTLTNTNEFAAYWSSVMSGADGLFITNPKIVITLDENIQAIPITLYFHEVVKKFKVTYKSGDTVLQVFEVANNTDESLTVPESVEEMVFSEFNKVEFEFIETAEPFRYVKVNEFDFGFVESFTSEEIIDIDVLDNLDLKSQTLQSNQLTLTVKNRGSYDIYNPISKLRYLQERQEMTVYHWLKVNGDFHQVPLGTFLLKDYESSNQIIRFTCYDDLFFMNKIYYGSKFYQNETVETILMDLFNYFNYTKYTIEDDVRVKRLTGYVPQVQFREALRIIAEAAGAGVVKKRDGITHIFDYDFISSDDVVEVFERKDLFNEKLTKNLYNNVIDVVENFYNTFENKLIYKATLEPGTYYVMYEDYPAINVTANIPLSTIYATSAVLTVTATTTVEIYGDVYNEKKVVHRIRKSLIAVDEYAVDKVDNPLITTNYSSIAAWKLERSDLFKDLEVLNLPYLEVGDLVQFENNYGNLINVRLSQINITASLKQVIGGE